MGLETVVKDIINAAQAEVAAINSEADSEVAMILDEAKDKAKKIVGEKLAKVEDDIEKIRQQEISSANLEVKRTMLNARKEVLEKVYDNAVEAISTMSPSKNEELLKAIIENYQSGGEKIYSNKDSKEIVEKLSTLTYAGEIDCIGGVIIENEDGTIRLDHTYDGTLSRVNEQSLKQTSDILFG